MIRSSRIPPLLDKICTDGIKLSLLISKDGELLGSSTSQKQQPQTPPTSKNKTTSESGDENIASISSPSWGSMNPSDIGALIAEVVEDYKRLGCELTLLDPSFAQSSSVGSRTDNLGGNSKHLRQQQQQQSSSNHEMQRQSQLMDDGSGKNASSTVTAGGGNDLSKMKERNGSHKDRGRFNCLLMELEMGLIGITSVTSSTYLIALAEITTEQGMMKDKLTVLASIFQENLEDIHLSTVK